MYIFSKVFAVLNKNKLVPSFLKLRTMLAEGTAVWSRANRLYSSSMYSGGSLRTAWGLGCGLNSVRFIVDRKWLRKSCASSSGLSPLPAEALWWFSGGLMGLLKLKPVNVSSRTFRERITPRLVKTETVMVVWREGLNPKSIRREDVVAPLLWIPANCSRALLRLRTTGCCWGQWDNSFALVDLVVWFWGQGCAVLTCLEMSLRPCSALLSLSPPGTYDHPQFPLILSHFVSTTEKDLFLSLD